MTSEPVFTSKHPGYKSLTVCEHFLYFPKAPQLAAFVKAAAQKEFGNVSSFPSGSEHCAIVRTTAVPGAHALEGTMRVLTRLARLHGGVYDGYGSFV